MIYFDNAATTKPDARAISRAQEYLTENYFNPSGLYRAGLAVQNGLKEARASLLARVADEENFELIVTSCGTESDNHAVFGCGKRGNVVTTAGEHSAVAASVSELKTRGAAEARFAPLCRDGSVNVPALLELVDEKTSLVSVIHVNNETGAVNDVNGIARLVKEKNPRTIFHSDGVQAYGKIPFRLGKETDLYSISAHKIGGLKGTGALIKRKSLALPPFVFGGGQENGRRSGTENVFGIKAFAYAAEERFRNLGSDGERIGRFKEELWTLLDKEIFVRLSPRSGSPYILSVSAPGVRGETLLHMADDRGLIVGTGSACSSHSKNRYSRVILACGYDKKTADGVLRLSFSPYTSEEEIRRGAEILNGVARALAAKTK